jgi:adenosine deaminase
MSRTSGGSYRHSLLTLPKAHLHIHLEGAVRIGTINEMAHQAGARADQLRNFTSIDGFLEHAAAVNSLIRDASYLERIAFEVVCDEASQGLMHLQLTISPQIFAPALGSVEAAAEMILTGLARGVSHSGLSVSVLWGIVRTDPPADRYGLVRLASRYRDATSTGVAVTGVGVVGKEIPGDIRGMIRMCRAAKDAGLIVVPHAGETLGPESVRDTIRLLAPDRIAHGTRAAEDRGVLQELADRGITCDLCLTSNVRLGVVPTITEHPIRRFLDVGVPVTINADDPTYFGTDLLSEFDRCRTELGFCAETMAQLAKTSIIAAGVARDSALAAETNIHRWLQVERNGNERHHER